MEKIAISIDKVNETVSNLTNSIEEDLNNINEVDKYDILKIQQEINNFIRQYRAENKRGENGKYYSKELEDKMLGYSQLLGKEFAKKFKDEYFGKGIDKDTVLKLKEYGKTNKDIAELSGVSEITIKRLSSGKAMIGGNELGRKKDTEEKRLEKKRLREEKGIKDIPWYEGIGKTEEEREQLIQVYYRMMNYLVEKDEPAAKAVEDWFDSRDSRFVDYVNDHVNPVALLKHIMKSEFDKYIFRTKKKDNLPESDINLDNVSNLEDFTEDIDASADERSINDKKQEMRNKYKEESFAFLDLNDMMKFASI
jgi:hypothetical protein